MCMGKGKAAKTASNVKLYVFVICDDVTSMNYDH